LKALLFNSKGKPSLHEVDINLINKWRSDDSQLLWIDVDGKENVDTQFLKSQFKLNDLALTDSTRDRHPPKYESFRGNIFVLLRSLETSQPGSNIYFSQVSLFVGERFLITRHPGNANVITELWSDYAASNLPPDSSVRNIFYQLFSTIAEQYISKIIDIEQRLESIEDALDKDDQDTYLPELISFNTNLRKIVRNLEYMEQVSKKGLKGLTADNKFTHEFVDVYEQVERGLSLAKLYQNLCTDLMNAYISVTSHRVNKVVKILTIVTVLFVPLGFIAGLYGMNFEYMPELKQHYGYFYVIGFMVTMEIMLIVILRKLKWF
jgi:magnesium transporter